MGRMDEEGDEDDLVFGDDDLTWNAVARASGVEEDAYRTRLAKGKNVMSTSNPSVGKRGAKVGQKEQASRKRAHIVIRDQDEEELNEEEEDEEEEMEEEEMVDEDFESGSNEDDDDDFVDLDDDE